LEEPERFESQFFRKSREFAGSIVQCVRIAAIPKSATPLTPVQVFPSEIGHRQLPTGISTPSSQNLRLPELCMLKTTIDNKISSTPRPSSFLQLFRYCSPEKHP
jgi:hypothetical protein